MTPVIRLIVRLPGGRNVLPQTHRPSDFTSEHRLLQEVRASGISLVHAAEFSEEITFLKNRHGRFRQVLSRSGRGRSAAGANASRESRSVNGQVLSYQTNFETPPL